MKKLINEWRKYLKENIQREPDRPAELDVPNFPQCPDGTREVEQKDKSIKCFDVDDVLVGMVPGDADAGPTPSPVWKMKQILDREARWRNNVKDINNRTINKGDLLIVWPRRIKGRTYKCGRVGCRLIKVVDVGAPYMLGTASVTIKGSGLWDNKPWSWPSLKLMMRGGTLSSGGEFLKITDKLTDLDLGVGRHKLARPKDKPYFYGTINKDGKVLIRRPGTEQFERTITPKAYKFIKDIAKEANKYDRVDVRSYLKLIYENVPGGVAAVERVSRTHGGDPTTQGVVLVYRSTAMKDVQWPDFITMRPGWENVKKDPGFWMKLQAQAYNLRVDFGKTILNIFNEDMPKGIYIAGRAPQRAGIVGITVRAKPSTTHHEIGHHINPWAPKYLPYWPSKEVEVPKHGKESPLRAAIRGHDRQIAELQAEHLALIKHYWATKGKLAKTPKEAERQIKEFVDKHEPKGYIYNMLRNRTYRRKLRLLYLQTVYNTPKKAKTMMAKYVAQQRRMVAEQAHRQ